MARLVCEAKLAYYPTSVGTVKKVKKLFNFEDGAQIVDPCCGEGDAVVVFKDCGRVYGVELETIRAQKAQNKVDVLLNADATMGVRRSLNWCSFLFLNPPYGVDSLGKRLELKFIDTWGGTVINGGYMLLIINQTSISEELIKQIRLQNFKPIASFYDEANDDYKNYGQFFMLFERQSSNYRHDTEALANFMSPKKAIEISQLSDTKFTVTAGRIPDMFKEIEFPSWKLDTLLSKSSAMSDFEKGLLTAQVGFGSIETLNEGQRQFLTASGAIDEPLKENELDKGLILKGTVKKVTSESSHTKDDEKYSCKVQETFVTEVFGLDLNTLNFYRYS